MNDLRVLIDAIMLQFRLAAVYKRSRKAVAVSGQTNYNLKLTLTDATASGNQPSSLGNDIEREFL